MLADAAAAAGGAEQWAGGGGKDGGAPKSGFVVTVVRPSGGSALEFNLMVPLYIHENGVLHQDDRSMYLARFAGPPLPPLGPRPRR